MNTNSIFPAVSALVQKNTGMGEALLLNDDTEYAFPALAEAEKIIRKWQHENKKFFVFADYDVDGITSGESMRMLLNAIGAKDVIVRYPRRFTEGYGMSVKAIMDDMPENAACITVDNGITAFEAIKAAKEKGAEVLVVDHHLPLMDGGSPRYPDADVLIDPNAVEGQADFKPYCGCGLVMKLAERLLAPESTELARIKAFAAIATVADSVPLTGENRRIVKEGLKLIIQTREMTKGLSALVSAFYLGCHVTETDIAFRIAPALNASGRLFDDGAEKAAMLISFDGDFREAERLAKEQITLNEKRKALQKEWNEKAENMVSDGKAVILNLEGCPEGLVGIVAGRLCEKYGVPAIVLTSDGDGNLKGSGRSVENVNLKEKLDLCRDKLLSYGGHAAAAGLRLKEDAFEDFRESFLSTLNGWEKETAADDEYDIEISGRDVQEAAETVLAFSPYGEGNPRPKFLIRDIHLTPYGASYFKDIGNDGVKLYACGFRLTSFTGREDFHKLGAPRCISVTGEVNTEYYGGRAYTDVNFTKLSAEETRNNMNKRISPLKARFAKVTA